MPAQAGRGPKEAATGVFVAVLSQAEDAASAGPPVHPARRGPEGVEQPPAGGDGAAGGPAVAGGPGPAPGVRPAREAPLAAGARPSAAADPAAAWGDRLLVTRSDATSLSVTVVPEGLGPLEVEVFLEGGAVNGRITAFDPAARDAVEVGLSRIVEALARDGIRVGGLAVSLGSREGGRPPGGGRAPLPGVFGVEEAGGEDRVPPNPSLPSTWKAPGRVDLYA